MINEKKLMELFVDTIQRCGTYLYNVDEVIIEYNIFEEFDTGVISFLHKESLTKLLEAGLISNEIMEKSLELRQKTIDLQNQDLWNIDDLKSKKEWKELFILSDEIREILE